MHVVVVRSYLKEMDFIAVLYGKADCFQPSVDWFSEHGFSVLSDTDDMVQEC